MDWDCKARVGKKRESLSLIFIPMIPCWRFRLFILAMFSHVCSFLVSLHRLSLCISFSLSHSSFSLQTQALADALLADPELLARSVEELFESGTIAELLRLARALPDNADLQASIASILRCQSLDTKHKYPSIVYKSFGFLPHTSADISADIHANISAPHIRLFRFSARSPAHSFCANTREHAAEIIALPHGDWILPHGCRVAVAAAGTGVCCDQWPRGRAPKNETSQTQ
jgi:hypothetical protein